MDDKALLKLEPDTQNFSKHLSVNYFLNMLKKNYRFKV